MKTLTFAITAALAGCILAATGVADRLYTWTDQKGVTHFTQDPPPTSGSLQDIVDYGHRSAAGPNPNRRQPDRTLPHDIPKIDRPGATTDISGEESQPRAEGPPPVSPAGPNSCYIQAPGTQVYVRVWLPDVYGDRGEEIWSGAIPANGRQRITIDGDWILYDYRTGYDGPFRGGSGSACSGDGVVSLP
jgi:hypothetical protein